MATATLTTGAPVITLAAHLAEHGHSEYLAVAEEAVAHAAYGDYSHEIYVPEGKYVTALDIIQRLDLTAFVEDKNFYDEDDDPAFFGV